MRLSPSGKWLIAAATVATVLSIVSVFGPRPSSARFLPPTVAKANTRLSIPTAPFAPTVAAIVTEDRGVVARESVQPAQVATSDPIRPAPEFQLGRQIPVGWMARRADAPRPQETIICFQVPGHPGVEPSVYYHTFSEPAIFWSTEVRAWLGETAEAKAAQRVREGLTDYQNRGDALPRIIGNRPALSWSAEFTRDGVPWVENLTRLFSPAGTALFFLKAPAAEIEEVQSLFDIVIESTVMPSLVRTAEAGAPR